VEFDVFVMMISPSFPLISPTCSSHFMCVSMHELHLSISCPTLPWTARVPFEMIAQCVFGWISE
jgi:hypothetical protein